MKIAFALVPLGLVMSASLWGEDRPITDDKVVEFVNQRCDQWWLTPEERRFDEIGWSEDIRAAKRLAVAHNRPVFLFTMDGRINTGRC